jgi:hypothetical protein
MLVPSSTRAPRPVYLAVSLALGLVIALGSAACRVAAPGLPHFAGATVAGRPSLLGRHDAHLHHPECGHAARFHEGQWIYFYGGRWEFHDPATGRWYAFAQ